MGQIYFIKNTTNGKGYVGQTTRTLEIRWKEHLKNTLALKDRLPLYKALAHYGKEAFTIELLEECPDELLNEREIFWIKEKETFGEKGYNCTTGGQGNVLPVDISIDIPAIAQRYQSGERLDHLCKEYGHDYISVRNRLVNSGIIINTLAGPEKLSKKIYQVDPLTKAVLAEYPSISAAARAICPEGHNYRAIANHISKQKDTGKTCHQFIWVTRKENIY